jgi:CheY-like chemotaxis protein
MTKKLLLADDSVTIQKVVNLTFADEDIVVESVANGDQAIEKARSIKPSIVLADVIMPGRSGYEVCASIKADPELSQTPVILLVGTFEPFDELEASRVKCDASLQKPFDTSELIQLVHKLLGRAPDDRKSEAAPEEAGGTGTDQAPPQPSSETLVSRRSWESFTGANSILDLFDECMIGVSRIPAPEESPAHGAATGKSTEERRERRLVAPDSAGEGAIEKEGPTLQVIPFPGGNRNDPESASLAVSEDLMDAIVQRVVAQLSRDVIREIASDIVPEISRQEIRDIAWEVVPEYSEKIIRQIFEEREGSEKS